jgi:glycosyltransferase involved in cell wall biosynthesis
MVVDDYSIDSTAEIARGFAGVAVVQAQTRWNPGWTGKANAIWTAASAGARTVATLH